MFGTKHLIYGLQLPHPSYRSSNIPLSLGYLASALKQSDLAAEAELQIAPALVNDSFGDTKLLSHLEHIQPRMVAFSVYPWNIDRTLSLARKIIARHWRHLRIVFGGPEIHPLNPKLAGFSGADYLVTGEGEIPFVETVRQLQTGDQAIDAVPSVAFWDGKSYRWNLKPNPAVDLSRLPSPYLHGLIPLAGRMAVNIFSYRGCYFHCAYCQWRTSPGVRSFRLEQTAAELDFALKGNKPILYLSDAAFNLSPHFSELCDCLQRARPYKKSIRCFVHLDSLTDDQARMLAASGIRGVEVGLQSIDPEVNRSIDRRFDREQFEYGLSLLRKYGINCLVDIIIGLPEADASSIFKTIEYVRGQGLEYSLFHLSVSSGSRLYEKKNDYQLRLQQHSPYYVLSTNSLSSEDVQEIYQNHTDSSADQDLCPDIGYPGITLPYFVNPEAFSRLPPPAEGLQGALTDWVIWAPHQRPFPVDVQRWLPHSAAKLSLWLFADRMTPFWLRLLKESITWMNTNENFTVLNIFLHLAETDPQVLHRLLQLNRQIGRFNTFLTHRDHFIADCCDGLRNDKGGICLILKQKTADMLKPDPELPVLSQVTIPETGEIDPAAFASRPQRGFLMALHPALQSDRLMEVLNRLQQCSSALHRFHFCQPAVQRLWVQKVRNISAEPMQRRMLLIKEQGTALLEFNDYDLALDAILHFDLVNEPIRGNHIEHFARKVRDRLHRSEPNHASAEKREMGHYRPV